MNALRTMFATTRARRTARRLSGVHYCDSCAQVSDNATRAADRRRHDQLTALTHTH